MREAANVGTMPRNATVMFRQYVQRKHILIFDTNGLGTDLFSAESAQPAVMSHPVPYKLGYV